jgi:hypothetical protein
MQRRLYRLLYSARLVCDGTSSPGPSSATSPTPSSTSGASKAGVRLSCPLKLDRDLSVKSDVRIGSSMDKGPRSSGSTSYSTAVELMSGTGPPRDGDQGFSCPTHRASMDSATRAAQVSNSSKPSRNSERESKLPKI